MIARYEDRETALLVAIPAGVPLRLVARDNETSSGQVTLSGFGLTGASPITEPARRTISGLRDRVLRVKAQALLETISDVVEVLVGDETKLDELPPFHVSQMDDGSALIEWPFPEFRVGFGIEPGTADSSWYLVSTRRLGDIGASGYIAADNVRKLVFWLVGFAVLNG